MNDLNEILRQLIDEARNLPLDSVPRKKKLEQIYLLVMKSGKLWREYKPYYNDALQDMWEYCLSHLEEYDTTEKEVITWLNDEIFKALNRHRYREKTRTQQILNNPEKLRKLSKPYTDMEPLLDIWEETVKWVTTDPEEVLRKTCFQERPEINAQVLILRKLPPDTPWQEIAREFNLNPAEAIYLPKWYNRKCLPLLRKFGYDQGYIEK